MRRRALALLLAASGFALIGCESAPKSDEQARSEPDLSMPASYSRQAPDSWTRPETMRVSYAPIGPLGRADDSLPGAFQELSRSARSVGERIASTADRIVVEKAAHRLTLYRGDTVLASFPVGLGDAYGDKTRQGDRRTPEGEYYVIERKDLGETNFHRAFLINYPNEQDRLQGKTGGEIEIHGLGPYYASLGSAHYTTAWTAGCMGLTDEQMDRIWSAVPLGTKVIIRA